MPRPIVFTCTADALAQIEAWQNWLRDERRRAPGTVDGYARDVAGFVRFLAALDGAPPSLERLAALRGEGFRAWLGERRAGGLGVSATARGLDAVRSFFRFIGHRAGIVNAAIDAVRVGRPRRGLPKPLTVAEAEEVIASVGALSSVPWIRLRDGALVMLLYGCGLRISEACALNRGDLPEWNRRLEAAGATGVLTVAGKGGRYRQVPVLPAVMAAITAYLVACPFAGGSDDPKQLAAEPVFYGARGERAGRHILFVRLRDLRHILGLSRKVTPHVFRHSFATHLLAGGGNLREIQELLGHASLASTQVYADADPSALRRVYDSAHPRAFHPDAPVGEAGCGMSADRNGRKHGT